MKQLFRLLVSAFLLGLVLAACDGSTGHPSSSSGPHTVQITEADYTIASSQTRFSAGTPYHFVVTNQGQTAHELMILPRSEGAMPDMPMSEMDQLALARVENIAPGQTVSLDYTFPNTTKGSHPQFACYYPGHYEAGMKLDVAVNP
jgi:uncharacterized cupredoxin-like copper-binding protein